MLPNNTEIIMVCRTANEPLSPSSVRMGNCKVCTEPLQVTAKGREQLTQVPGVILLCTPCGVTLSEVFQKKGALDGAMLSPEAEEQMGRLKTRDAERMREVIKKLKVG